MDEAKRQFKILIMMNTVHPVLWGSSNCIVQMTETKVAYRILAVKPL
jgi:hypothetical protein